MVFRRTRSGMSNRYSHDRGSWMSKDASHYQQADAAYTPAAIAEPRYVVHPVVKAPEHKCFRVIRLFKQDNRLAIEDIGYGTAKQAMAILSTEEWRAQVLDLNGRVHSDNWRALEKRS